MKTSLDLLLLATAPSFRLSAYNRSLPLNFTPVLICAGQDLFSFFFNWASDVASRMSPALFWCIAREAVGLQVITIACGLVFKLLRFSISPGAITAINWAIFIFGWLLVAALPLQSLRISPEQKAWVVLPAFLTIAILPFRLSWLLVPIEGHRRIAARSIYAGLGLLLLIQLFVS